MTTITIHQAKTPLSRYLAAVGAGQESIIARGSAVVAKLIPFKPKPRAKTRPKCGQIKGPPFEFTMDSLARLIAAQAMEAGLTILSPNTPLSVLGAARIW